MSIPTQKVEGSKAFPAAGDDGADAREEFNRWVGRVLEALQSRDVFGQQYQSLTKTLSGGKFFMMMLVNFPGEENIKLAEAFIETGTANRGNVDAYYQQLHEWVTNWGGSEQSHKTDSNGEDKVKANAEGNRDINLPPTFEDDLTHPHLPDSSPLRSEVSGHTYGRFQTPEHDEMRSGSVSRALSQPISSIAPPHVTAPRAPSVPSHFAPTGLFSRAQPGVSNRPHPIACLHGLSPLKEMEEPSDDEADENLKDLVKRSQGGEEKQLKANESAGLEDGDNSGGDDGGDTGKDGSKNESQSGADEDQLEEDEDQLEEDEDQLEEDDDQDEDEDDEDIPEPSASSSGHTSDVDESTLDSIRKKTSGKGAKRKADERDSDDEGDEVGSRVFVTRSGRKVRLIKSAAVVEDSDEDGDSFRQKPLPPPVQRPSGGSSKNHKDKKDPLLKGLATTPCGRCAQGNRTCMVWVNKPTARACATCNCSHTGCDWVGSVKRSRRSNPQAQESSKSKSRPPTKSKSRPPVNSRSRSPSRKRSQSRKGGRDRDSTSMDVDDNWGRKTVKSERTPDPYSAEALAKRRGGKSRAIGMSSGGNGKVKRSPSESARPSKRVKIEVPYWDTEDEQNAGPSREVSNSRMSNLQRDIERLELGRQSDNEFYSKKLSNIDNKMTSMEGDMAEVQGRLTRAESLQEQNTVPFRSIRPSPVPGSGGLDEIGSLSPVPCPCG